MSEAISIEQIPIRGAAYMGVAIRKVTVELANGSTVSFDVKTSRDDISAKKIANMRARILGVMREKGIPLVRKQISKALGLESQSGWYGMAIRSMIDDGTISEDEDGMLIVSDVGDGEGEV